MTRGSVDDPYVYPGTSTLRNRLDIREPDLLRIAEYAISTRRNRDSPVFPVSAVGFQAIHRHLFQDLYTWAGEIRTVGLRNPREAAEFARPTLIAGVLDKQFRTFASQGDLAGLDMRTFAARTGEHLGEVNAIHPFREGNGRTMRLHLRQLAATAGFALDDDRLRGSAWNDASRISFNTGHSAPLAAVIETALVPARERPLPLTAQLSADAKLVYAALAIKVDREMTHLSSAERADLRAYVARDLIRKEDAEGPVVLSAAQRRAAEAPEPPQPKQTPPQTPAAPRRGR